MQLLQLTSTLIQACDEATNRFFKMRELDIDPDFFGEVKPYADEMHAHLHEWQQLAQAWIVENRPKYMHKPQIDNAVDAMEQFIVQSFYKATSKKRFIQSVQSVHYTLSNFYRYVQEANDRV